MHCMRVMVWGGCRLNNKSSLLALGKKAIGKTLQKFSRVHGVSDQYNLQTDLG